MDTLLSIRVFAAVAEAKSFTTVADRLGLSAAMTSKHIQRLESEVGARLLNRASRQGISEQLSALEHVGSNLSSSGEQK